jgi:glycolate oxidase iron-sulfur subunit
VLGVEADSPRGRIYLMRALAEGRVEDPAAIRPFLDRCLDCRACETACPSGVHYGEILETTRAELVRTAPDRRFLSRLASFLLWHVVARQRRLRMLFSFARAGERLGLRRLLPRPMRRLLPTVPPRSEREPLPVGLHRPPASVRRRDVRVALFTGCVMEQMFGRVNRATLRLLLANGFDVVVPAAQRCCGALLVHAGRPDRARSLARANVNAFAGVDVVVNNSAGCGCALREYGVLLDDGAAAAFAARCRDVAAFLAEVGLSAVPAACRAKVAYDDPCHLCHGQGVRAEPRALLRQVPGLQLVEHEGAEDCCGSAGIYNLLQPALAGEIGRRKVESLRAAGADLVVTGNPGCMLQIDSHLRDNGTAIPVRHLVELLLPPS